jgi:hypothetical protein
MSLSVIPSVFHTHTPFLQWYDVNTQEHVLEAGEQMHPGNSLQHVGMRWNVALLLVHLIGRNVCVRNGLLATFVVCQQARQFDTVIGASRLTALPVACLVWEDVDGDACAVFGTERLVSIQWQMRRAVEVGGERSRPRVTFFTDGVHVHVTRHIVQAWLVQASLKDFWAPDTVSVRGTRYAVLQYSL